MSKIRSTLHLICFIIKQDRIERWKTAEPAISSIRSRISKQIYSVELYIWHFHLFPFPLFPKASPHKASSQEASPQKTSLFPVPCPKSLPIPLERKQRDLDRVTEASSRTRYSGILWNFVDPPSRTFSSPIWSVVFGILAGTDRDSTPCAA